MRQFLERTFREERSTALKTWVLEVHPGKDEFAFLESLAGTGAKVEKTQDEFLHLLRFPDHKVDFYVDRLERRFWSFHTWGTKRDSTPILKDLVGTRRNVDWTWLPSDHLDRTLMGGRPRGAQVDFRGWSGQQDSEPLAGSQRLQLRVGGTAVADFLASVRQTPVWMHALALEKVEVQVQDEEFGFAREAVGRQGCFAAVGDSFALHQAFVRETIARYRELVEAVERRLLRWSGDADQGLQLGGGAIALELSEPLHDLDGFLQALFSCREPFRLWGIPDEVADGVWQAEAVDLHVGQPLRIQLSDRWLRLILGEGSCGNTVARLVANLQHGVDSCVRFVDPELQALLEAGAAEHRVPSTDPPSP